MARKAPEIDRKIYQDDGRYITWTAEFRKKEKYLEETYEEVEPEEFIRELLPAEYLDEYQEIETLKQKAGAGESTHTGKGTGIIKTYIGKKKVTDRSTGEEREIDSLRTWYLYNDYKGFIKARSTPGQRKAVVNLCTYFGRYQAGKKAKVSKCFGFAIDLDYVGEKELKNLLGMMDVDLIPYPTYIVNSGKGVHLYYLFEKPVDVQNEKVESYLDSLKKELIYIIWTAKTSRDPSIQLSGIKQDMRCPGSWSKLGKDNKVRCTYKVRCFRVADRVDLTYLRDYIDTKNQQELEDLASESSKAPMPLAEAKEKYPAWYEKNRAELENHQPLKHDSFKPQHRGLYLWWRRIITQEDARHPKYTTREGNRYHAVWMLFVLAYKAGVAFEDVYSDALWIIPIMNSREHAEDNPFTLEDVESASKGYDIKYHRISRKYLEEITGIELPSPAIRRNGRSQADHLEIARAIRDIKQKQKGTNWRDGNGRPAKGQQVKEWRETHPEGTKAECIRETGLSKPTVYKWWE